MVYTIDSIVWTGYESRKLKIDWLDYSATNISAGRIPFFAS